MMKDNDENNDEKNEENNEENNKENNDERSHTFCLLTSSERKSRIAGTTDTAAI